MKKPIPTFNIQLSDMFTECRNKNKAKVKRWKFKQWLLEKAEREEREAKAFSELMHKPKNIGGKNETNK